MVALLTVALGACGGSKSGPPASTTTTSAGAPAVPAVGGGPYAVPADPSKIDEPYLDGVLAALNHVAGDVTRRRLSAGRFEQDDLIALRAIYNDPEFPQQADALAKAQPPPPDQLRQPLGDRRMTVKQILLVHTTCVALIVNDDFTAVLTNPPPVKDWYVTLEPTDPNTDPKHLNPTPWSFGYDGDAAVSSCAG